MATIQTYTFTLRVTDTNGNTLDIPQEINIDDGVVVANTRVGAWGNCSSSGGIVFDPSQSYNTELVGASTVEITGYYLPALTSGPAFNYPPSSDPVFVSLEGHTLVNVSVPLANNVPGMGAQWYVNFDNPIPEGVFLALISVDGVPSGVARIGNCGGF